MSDTISRQAAIEAIEEYADRLQMVNWKENPNVPYKVHSLNWCINKIRDLPSAQPERHGKWVPKTIIIGGRDHVSGMKCSVCGEDPLNAEGDEFLTDYCPNCGARMDGEVEGRKK